VLQRHLRRGGDLVIGRLAAELGLAGIGFLPKLGSVSVCTSAK